MTNERAIERLKERITDNQEKTLQIFLEQDIEAIKTVLNLLEKKDRQIDEMAQEILYKEPLKYNNIQEVKQYYERKVEEDR